MKKYLQLDKSRELTTGWKWRSKNGTFRSPTSMETTHLFYVLRMIWNHTMPQQAWVRTPGRPINFYIFSDFYTVEYMKDAIHHIWAELSNRTDIPVWAQIQLGQMHSYYDHRLRQEHKELPHAQG